MKKFTKGRLFVLAAVSLITLHSCGQSYVDSTIMKERAEQLKKAASFQYPLDDYFPEIPVTKRTPPRGESYHTGEDSFAPAGTPVYAIGDGIIRYSGKSRGYGWLIIIDHPDLNVYSLYGHLAGSNWKKSAGQVKKGELIAYLAEAEEAETMLPHIHFGIRMGQQQDYPVWGNWRWMAGYTSCPPALVGWFYPSEIIGETDSMRVWHSYIQKREDHVSELTLHASDFRITSGKYSEKDNLDQAIKSEFGEEYRLADWEDILLFSSRIKEWVDSLGLTEGEENGLLISNEGYRIWLGRQYFISRFNHNKPAHFLDFGAIDNNFVCLGSWFGLNRHILAVKR